MHKVCKICGREFDTTCGALTCSPECAKKNKAAWNKQHKTRIGTVTKYCKICGKPFTAANGALTCGPECAKANKRSWQHIYQQHKKAPGKFDGCAPEKKKDRGPMIPIDDVMAVCNKLGIQYGDYAKLRDTGKLEKYKKDRGIC